jgi:hypothetical protein
MKSFEFRKVIRKVKKAKRRDLASAERQRGALKRPRPHTPRPSTSHTAAWSGEAPVPTTDEHNPPDDHTSKRAQIKEKSKFPYSQLEDVRYDNMPACRLPQNDRKEATKGIDMRLNAQMRHTIDRNLCEILWFVAVRSDSSGVTADITVHLLTSSVLGMLPSVGKSSGLKLLRG